MATQRFSKGEAVRFGWNMMKSNFWFFVGLLVLIIVIFIPLALIQGATEETAPFISLIVRILSWMLELLMAIGLIRISLKFCDNEKGTLSDLFSGFPQFLNYLFGTLLYSLMILGGLILLIVPAVVWGIKFQFYSYCIVEGLGPVEALRKSAALTKGTKWHLFLFGLLLIGINLLGAACLLVGLLATVPATMLAVAFVYRKLLASLEGQGPETAPLGGS